ncbi:hypothetical protein CMO91_02130 [Candidatus Woesearchaeota archaeon]|jgi:cytochrome c-type biogenesis protein|nr:hypothetical protein [Candidatus Woesearchaeota archaeon]|tara:strand:+ start:243 stop:1061 length:819 start_codon:yes stop_codon:yes gene_type:complete
MGVGKTAILGLILLLLPVVIAGEIDDIPTPETAGRPVTIFLIISFFGGVISFINPCTLPVLAAFFGYNTKKVMRNTLLFVLGLTLVFSLFGTGAAIVGGAMKANQGMFTKIVGLALIGLGVFELSGRGFTGYKIKVKNQKAGLGSFVFGMAFAVGWSACVGPILAGLLLLAATSTIINGTLLLFAYALGLGLPFLLIAPHFEKVKQTKIWSSFKGRQVSVGTHKLHTTSIIAGILLIAIGILVFLDYFTSSMSADQVQNFVGQAEAWFRIRR